jgi:hypothetical protein
MVKAKRGNGRLLRFFLPELVSKILVSSRRQKNSNARQNGGNCIDYTAHYQTAAESLLGEKAEQDGAVKRGVQSSHLSFLTSNLVNNYLSSMRRSDVAV